MHSRTRIQTRWVGLVWGQNATDSRDRPPARCTPHVCMRRAARLVKMAVIRPPSVSPVPPPEQNNTAVEKESTGAGETKSKPPLREYTL